MRFLIASKSVSSHYQGMDRPLLGMRNDVSDDVIVRGMALEDLPPNKAEAGYRNFVAELGEHYELLRLGNAGKRDEKSLGLGETSEADWELLGYDVGETTDRAWSALAHRQQLGMSEPLLNSYGLFDNQADAQHFLRAYLEHDDPDRGWSTDGWQEHTDIYAVIPIYRLRNT